MIVKFQGPVRASIGSISVTDGGVFCDDNDETVWYYSLAEWLYLSVAVETCSIVGVDSYGGIPSLESSLFPGVLGTEFYTAFVVGDCNQEPGFYLDDKGSFVQSTELVDPVKCLWWIGDVVNPGIRVFENGWIHCTPQGRVTGLTIQHVAFGGPLPLFE